MTELSTKRWFSRALLGLTLGLGVSGCAMAPATPQALAANDPFEPANRNILALNNEIDRRLLNVTVERYRSLPDGLRRGVHNFLHNLALPTIFVNDVLQGAAARAGQSAARFTINSSLGIGGLFDAASPLGIADHSEDFGQTLAVWGLAEGPFLMLPFLGPSDVRDATGLATDTFLLDPTNYVHLKNHLWWDAGRQYFTLLDLRSQTIDTLQDIQRSSVDYYASLRSLYRQVRNSQIRNGAAEKTDELPDF